MEFVFKYLKDWGLDEYVQSFTDNAIDKEAFLNLEDSDIKELIPVSYT